MKYTHQCDAQLPEWLDDLAVKEAAPKKKEEAPPAGDAPPPPEPAKGDAPPPPEAPPPEDKGTNEPVKVPAEGEAPPPPSSGDAGDEPAAPAEAPADAGGAMPPPPGGDAGGGEAPAEPKEKKDDEGTKTEEEKTTDVGDALDKLKEQLGDLNKGMKTDVEKGMADTAEKFNKQVEDVTKQIDALKTQIKELSKEKGIEEQLKTLQKRLDNLSIPTDADLNDSLNQSASKIATIQRYVRRIKEAQSFFEFEFTKGRDQYHPNTKTIVTEASSIGLKPGNVPPFVDVKNPKTGVSVRFKYYDDDKSSDGEDIAGFKYKAIKDTWGVKELLIIND